MMLESMTWGEQVRFGVVCQRVRWLHEARPYRIRSGGGRVTTLCDGNSTRLGARILGAITKEKRRNQRMTRNTTIRKYLA